MACGRSGMPKTEIYGPRVVLGAASSQGTGASVPRNPEENRGLDWSGRQDLNLRPPGPERPNTEIDGFTGSGIETQAPEMLRHQCSMRPSRYAVRPPMYALGSP